MAEDKHRPPDEITEAAVSQFRAEYPDCDYSHTRVRAEEPDRYVLAVYSPVPGLLPTPYFIYAVDRKTLTAKRLSGDDGKPYAIPNYK